MTTRSEPADHPTATAPPVDGPEVDGPNAAAVDEPLPSLSEQVAEQLGGVRGLVESSVPVTVFVVVNFIGPRFHLWSLRESLIASVGLAVGIAIFRLSRRQPIRHAVNGVFGILLGAMIAWRSGEARDFYLPGIIIGAANGGAMLISAVVRRPLVGWLWSVMLDGGGTRWYRQESLRRVFGWLTVLWATVYLLKVALQYGLYLAHQADLLGVIRLVLGWPPYALLLAVTVWVVRRVIRREGLEPAQPAATTAAEVTSAGR
jgi:hypothetical protein